MGEPDNKGVCLPALENVRYVLKKNLTIVIFTLPC